MNSKILFGFVLVVLVALCQTTEARRTKWNQLEGYTFDRYIKEHGKNYETDEEYFMRKAIFEANLEEIQMHNKNPTATWKKGVNHLTDRTEAEFRHMLGLKKSLLFKQVSERQESKNVKRSSINIGSPLPNSIDWRDANIVTPVKDQGGCGSCWTFGTASTVESYYALATGLLPILSEQQILDCTPNPDACGGTGGCEGGTTEIAYAKIQALGGLSSEWTYPYRSYHGDDFPSCSFSSQQTPPVAQITGFISLPSNDYNSVMETLATVGPLAVNVDASAWSSYEEGVFTGCNLTNPDIDHVVQLVGYGVDPVYGDYWLVRNSWSPSWGESGYIRIARSSSAPCGEDSHPQDGTGCNGGPSPVTVCGECAILFDTTYPVILRT